MSFDLAPCADQYFQPRPFSEFFGTVASDDVVQRPTSARLTSVVDERTEFIQKLKASIQVALREGAQLDAIIRNIKDALHSLNCLPQEFPLPSPAVDEDGSVLFDWIASKDVMLSAMYMTGKIVYSSYIRGQNDNAEFDIANETALDKFASAAEGWLRTG